MSGTSSRTSPSMCCIVCFILAANFCTLQNAQRRYRAQCSASLTYADNVALPAFARRAAVRRAAIDRTLSPVGRAHSSKPAGYSTHNKSAFGFLHMLTTWHRPRSHAALLCAAQQSIVRYLLSVGPTAANLLDTAHTTSRRSASYIR